jgi:glucosamine--fructose-6-phosphate aminotransferase (isomerizing)
MCGIVGYTGNRQALSLLLGGLAQLEYRGYDSTGLCLLSEDGRQRVRADSNLAALRDVIGTRTLGPATAGIGHTRWATHGEVSVANTHPFLGCGAGTYAVALNGIIENFVELRERLYAQGHIFESSTDAEVVAHLLEEHSELSLDEALAAVARELDGHFGIVAIDERHPNLLAGTRRQVPLVVGVGDAEHFLCSSIDAILAETARFVLLEDDDIVLLDGATVRVRRPNGEWVDREEIRIDRPAVSASHEGYGSFMAKEIAEQPRAIEDTLAGRIEGTRVRFDELCDLSAETSPGAIVDLHGFERLVIVGCGTALHAGQVAKPMFQGWARLHTDVAFASEWRHADPIVDARTLVIAVSQSGETADTLEAVRLAKRLGATTIGVTNMPDSQMTREVDRFVLTTAGVEMSVAATKTFTAQVAMLALLAYALGSARGTLDGEDAEQVLMELELIPAKLQVLLDRSSDIARIGEIVSLAPFVVYLGRRAGVPVALEGALKLREIAYMPAEVHPAGELKHGSIALMEQGTPVIAVVTDGTEPDRTLSSLHEVRARGAHVIAIATEGNQHIASVADEVIWIPSSHPMLEPLLSVVPLQLLAHDIAVARGLNVDQPRNLAKTVTVE